MRKFIALISVALFSLYFAGTANAAGHAKKADHVVEIKGMSFSTKDLSVKVGDTVMFINKDGAPHTATAKDGSFDTGRVKKNESAIITVSSAGSFAYFCSVHPSMKALLQAK